jgi:hypothetical protein
VGSPTASTFMVVLFSHVKRRADDSLRANLPNFHGGNLFSFYYLNWSWLQDAPICNHTLSLGRDACCGQ